MPTSPMSPGTVLGGRYRLEDLLTEHDGARFWRATDVVLARSVAVHAVASDDPRSAAVLDAARSSVRVTDPHFLRVLDCDDDDGLTWVINEWGEGDSLDVMLEQGPLPPARAAWLAREVSEAIVAAHAQGLCHGRLNPESVLVTESGAVKVIGFVVYTAFAGRAGRDTSYGVVNDRDADVIDLAGILFAALTGRWPGVTTSRVPRAPREGQHPLRPRQVRAGVPRTLDAICDRVLNREASRHVAPLSTALEVCAALSDFVGDPAAMAPIDIPAMHQEPEPAPEPGAEAEAEADSPAQPAEVAAPEPAPEDGPETDPKADAGADVPAAAVIPPAAAATPPAPAEPDQTMPHAFGELDPTDLSRPDDWEPAPPPPPFEEVADRPLFADHDRRVPAGAAPDPATSSGTPGWPFYEDAPTGGDAGDRPRRRWRRLLVIVLLFALAGAMYIAFDLGRQDETPESSGPSPTPTPSAAIPTGTPIKVFRAADFDPEGDPPSENPDQTPLAIDGNPSTGWKTLVYRDDPRLGGLKSGVGIVLDLGSEQAVGSIELDLAGAPTSFEIWTSPPGIDDPPVELADLRRRVGQTATGTLSVARFESPVRTRYILVWLTKLPEAPGGFRGEITEAIPRP